MAGGITEQTIEEIKARTDLADLIASYGIQIKSAGAAKKACCPFHHEKTPSFSINDRKGFYHCFGCGESGDAIKFVMKMDGLTFVEAVRKLASQCGVEIAEREDPAATRRRRLYALLAELAAFYRRCLVQIKEAQPAREYLASRDLDERLQEQWTIGYAPNGVANILKWAAKYGYTPEELETAGVIKAPNRAGDQGYHRFGGRLMFTIRDKQGRVVGFSGRQLVASKNSGKYVNSPETPVFSKKHILFGFDRAAGAISKDPHREVIVCEGQIDCIRLHSKGFANVVASQGTAFTEEHMKMLRKVADAATLVFDDDAAGHKAAIRSAAMLLAYEMPVKVVALPGGDDPDSFLRAHPAEEFRALLDRAESIVSFQCRVESAKEADPRAVDALTRISRAVLNTIAASRNEVQKVAMLEEASRTLGIPQSALAGELRKVKGEPHPMAGAEALAAPADDADETKYEPQLPEEELRPRTPPPASELAFCQFLMANEYDAQLAGMVGEFLPAKVFAHEFTARFVDCWREECGCGEDRVLKFAENLEPAERGWLDAILLDAGKSAACELAPAEVLENFVRSLWRDALKRRRDALAAASNPATAGERLQLTVDLRNLGAVKWHTVKEMIRTHMEGEF